MTNYNRDESMEEIHRRFTGSYYTPEYFVRLAHQYISNYLGDDWYDNYVVWDSSAGSGAIFAKYNFKRAFASTLEHQDIPLLDERLPGVTTFQLDFLNDELPDFMIDLFKDPNNKFIFFNNSPFGSCRTGSANTINKAGIAKNIIGDKMRKEKWNGASSQLYTQFLYRINSIIEWYNLDALIANFSGTAMFTGSKFNVFRKKLLSNYSFKGGFLFSCKHFQGTGSTEWPVSFYLLDKSSKGQPTDNYLFDLYDYKDNEFINLGTYNIYNCDNKNAANIWVREPIKGKKTIDAPQLTSALKIKQTGRGSIINNALGYMHNNANLIQDNQQLVGLYSSAFAGGNGIPIAPDIDSGNFWRIVSLFAARRLIDNTWLNNSDEYLAPNTEHHEFNSFLADSYIYSLFNKSSNQSSMRDITYKNKLWDIKNEFFFMSSKEISEAALACNNNELYEDALNRPESFMYKQLQEIELSPEAQKVLDLARVLVLKSIPYRQHTNPKFHLNTWDAGWYQVRMGILKEHFKEELAEFKNLYIQLSNKMRPLVYELGFLINQTGGSHNN